MLSTEGRGLMPVMLLQSHRGALAVASLSYTWHRGKSQVMSLTVPSQGPFVTRKSKEKED